MVPDVDEMLRTDAPMLTICDGSEDVNVTDVSCEGDVVVFLHLIRNITAHISIRI